jgi:hypothetical protein
MPGPPKTCPSCGGDSLRHGILAGESFAFYLEKPRWFSRGWELRAYVCMDCGQMGLYLDDEQRRKLREGKD